MKSLVIVIGFTMFWVFIALSHERKDQQNAYIAAKSRREDSIPSALRKIRYCTTYDLRTIKWRRSLISAFIVTILLFSIIWRRLPTPSEFICHILLITTIFSTVWSNFATLTSSDASNYVDANISHIKSLLTENSSFILPNWELRQY